MSITLMTRPRFRYTLKEAADRHGLTVQQLTLAVRRHQLRVLRAGRQLWVSEADLAEYLEREHPTASLHGRPSAWWLVGS